MVEFYKRGLPHTHILYFFFSFFVHLDDKYPTSTQIDEIILATILNKDYDLEAYKVAKNFIIHELCCIVNKITLCMPNIQYMKYYPKEFYDPITMDKDGFSIYWRRCTKVYVKKKKYKV